MTRFFPYGVCGLFVLAGLVMAAYGGTLLYRAQQSTGWPCTDGRITRSEIVLNDASYSPTVVYAYMVDGVDYQGTDIACAPRISTGDGDYARRCVARYPVGAPVAVYYDPDEPTTAVLEPGLSGKSFVPVVFGLYFAAFGGWIGLLFWLANAKMRAIGWVFGVGFVAFLGWFGVLFWLISG
jgi:hypothetical protein